MPLDHRWQGFSENYHDVVIFIRVPVKVHLRKYCK